MIKKILCGILLGFSITLFVVQFDPWVQQRVGTFFVQLLADTFTCRVSGQVASLSLFPPAMTLHSLSLSSVSGDPANWSWGATTYKTGFSWLYLLFGGAIDMWIEMEDVQVYSTTCNGKLAILPHVKDLLKGPDLPIPLFLKSVKIKNGTVTIDNGLHTIFYVHGESRKIGTQFRSQFYVHDGVVKNEQTEYVKNMYGTIGIDATEKGEAVVVAIRVDGRGEMTSLGEYQTCFITGRWFDDRGRFQVHNIDHSFGINPLILSERDDAFYIDANIYAQMTHLAKLCMAGESNLGGTALIQIRGSLDPNGTAQGYLRCQDITHPWLPKSILLRSSFIKKELLFTGDWDLRGSDYQWHGCFSWDGAQNKGEADAINTLALQMPWYTSCPWYIASHDMKLHCAYDTQHAMATGEIACLVTKAAKAETCTITGKAQLDAKKHLTGHAAIGTHRFTLDAWNDERPRIEYMSLVNKDDHPLFKCTCNQSADQYSGLLDIALLRFLSDFIFHYDLHGQGALLFNGRYADGCLYADMRLKDATMRLPQTLNFMHECSCSCCINIASGHIRLCDVHCLLHSGSLHIPTAVIRIGQGELQFMHIPIIIDHCLFTVKHDLFAMVSGGLLLQKRHGEKPKIAGNIILDRSQLKENLFSESVQKKLLHSSQMRNILPLVPLTSDITIETKEPVRIDTPFLQANAHLALQIQDELMQPSIAGTIWIPSGSITFPYKPLHVAAGTITFLPEQPFNPLIELIAKNNIKNHNVSLHIAGSLHDPMIQLESTPPLTEEQIVGLLLAGAHEESLQAIIPSLLMQNVTNYIFSSHKSNFFDQYIKPWMKQINVHLVPNFNEQSGRGGLRGALEITVNDRWRALIEKNFNLTEDTRFELEYILSDDITFRVVRDERCDIGAEVEMRWKF